MKKTLSPRLLSFGVLIMLTACQMAGQLSSAVRLKPGDRIEVMSLARGGREAVPLWAFCSPAQHADNTVVSHCSVPMVPRLAIGHVATPGDKTLMGLNWSEVTWELTIDGRPIDLESFSIYSFVTPATSQRPSPVREIFVQVTAWDIVLTNLSPGEHTIRWAAEMGSESSSWVINLSIRDNTSAPRNPG